MGNPFLFDFKKPDYNAVLDWRIRLITKLREDDGLLASFKEYYKDNPIAFINHWGCTFDPRNADIGLPTTIPFVLYERQEEWIEWVLRKWHNRESGLSEKSRDVGLTWLAVAFSCTLCLFNDGISIGFGSRKEEYVDKIGDPKCIFWKARMFMAKLPRDFRGSWDLKTHAPHMRLLFPDTNSSITGESGDGIGRGDRKTIYFVDEAAHIERPALVEASLSNTTNCRIDISSVAGMANPFAQKVAAGKIEVFVFDWRHDPRKDDAWYAAMKEKLDPVSLAQEVDRNYTASLEGIVIPNEWVQAAIGAAEKLGIEVTGSVTGAMDVADEGVDLNCFGTKKGIELETCYAFSGKGSDILFSVEKVFMLCDEYECNSFQYDADGLGASVRGDSRMINERRKIQEQKQITATPFRGSGEVGRPEHEMVKGRKNKDFFMNRKAQAWWALRIRFQQTFRAITEPDYKYDPDAIISLSPKMKELSQLTSELSQPTYTLSVTGKVVIDKAPDGTRSPNRADMLMMLYAPPIRGGGLF